MQPSITWSSSVSLFVTEMMAIIHFLKCTVPFSFAVQLLSLAVTHCQSLSLFVTHFHSLSLVVTHCHSVPFVVTRCHSLSLVLPLVVTRCHSLSLVVPLVVTRCHSLSLAVPLVCLFIKDRKYSAQARLHCVFYFYLCFLLWFYSLYRN